MLAQSEEPASAVVSASGSSSQLDRARVGDAHNSYPATAQEDWTAPPGIVGEVAQYLYDQSPYPNETIALAGAVGFLSGIVGRSYNVSRAGLNQYVITLANTGVGKEAIADGISKLMLAMQVSVPAISDFKGPGYIASAPALLKVLARSPCCFILIGEFGYRFQALASPKANVNDVAIKAAFLDLYGKSGAGKLLAGMAYSDRDKDTAPILSPALTLIGESTPETFFAAVDGRVIADGLLPRFMVFQTDAKRPYLNVNAVSEPPPALVQRLADLASTCLTLAHNNQVMRVGLDADATATFQRFEQWTTDQINNSQSEASRQLWNRANLKALKLAALCAVGINPTEPVIGKPGAMWATNLIAAQTNVLLARFDSGDVGETDGNQVKRLDAMRRVIAEYRTAPLGKYANARCSIVMQASNVLTHKYLNDRLFNLQAFKGDKAGSTAAIKRTIETLVNNGELQRGVSLNNSIDGEVKGATYFIPNVPDRGVEYRQLQAGGGSISP